MVSCRSMCRCLLPTPILPGGITNPISHMPFLGWRRSMLIVNTWSGQRMHDHFQYSGQGSAELQNLAWISSLLIPFKSCVLAALRSRSSSIAFFTSSTCCNRWQSCASCFFCSFCRWRVKALTTSPCSTISAKPSRSAATAAALASSPCGKPSRYTLRRLSILTAGHSEGSLQTGGRHSTVGELNWNWWEPWSGCPNLEISRIASCTA